ncbi:7881_t:CDS:1, partial [Funneliformis caledonium]
EKQVQYHEESGTLAEVMMKIQQIIKFALINSEYYMLEEVVKCIFVVSLRCLIPTNLQSAKSRVQNMKALRLSKNHVFYVLKCHHDGTPSSRK